MNVADAALYKSISVETEWWIIYEEIIYQQQLAMWHRIMAKSKRPFWKITLNYFSDIYYQ